MKTKLCLMLGLIISGALSARAQTVDLQNQQGFIVQSSVKSTSVETDRSLQYVRVELRNEIINKGQTPIILWQPVGLDSLWVKPYVFVRLKMSRDPAFAKRDILEDRYGGPSLSTGPKWENTRKALDKASPPDRITRTVLPDQSITFDSHFSILWDEKRGDSIPGHPTLDELLEAGVVWIQVYYETWSFNLEPDPRKQKFGHKLQERWRKYGTLLLDHLCTEPIRIDLKAAILEERKK